MTKPLIIIGGGLAGSEAAWQAAERGISVKLYEMRPQKSTGAHVSEHLAELVCSNSLGSNLGDRAGARPCAAALQAELLRTADGAVSAVSRETQGPTEGWNAATKAWYSQGRWTAMSAG